MQSKLADYRLEIAQPSSVNILLRSLERGGSRARIAAPVDCHVRVAGIVRVDTCGALVLPSAGAVRAITATEVSFGHLTYREKPGQPQGVPIWDFAR